MNSHNEFYIGWQARAPSGIGAHVRKISLALATLVLALALILPLAQRTIGLGVFEWGTVRNFKGVLQAKPYPRLLVMRPGQGTSSSAYHLVAPFKFGLNTENLALDGKLVTLKGTLVYRDNQTMIEVRPESIKAAPEPASFQESNPTNAGYQTLVGEIVDSKCYLGVMNPGRWTPHRGCAVRCISGGIPPVLIVQQQAGPPRFYLLVSRKGQPVNKQVLDMIAEPIEITGEVIKQGDLAFLRADPSTYRRVAK